MRIEVDKRKSHKLYVDTDCFHRADENNIIKLIATNTRDKVEVVIDIIVGNRNLPSAAKVFLREVIDAKDKSKDVIINKVARLIAKHKITVSRIYDKLEKADVVYTDGNDEIKLKSNVAKAIESARESTFVVIELDSGDTSRGISIK